jgi:hypothetical protein
LSGNLDSVQQREEKKNKEKKTKTQERAKKA